MMKKRRYSLSFVTFIVAFTAFLSAFSCIRDVQAPCPPTALRAGEREVEIMLTRAGEVTDRGVATIDVLVFDGAGTNTDNAKFLYSTHAWNRSASTYTSVLKLGTELDIYFAVNARSVVSGAALVAGTTTWAQARQMLEMTTSSDLYTVGETNSTGLPMWGKVLDATIADSPKNSLGTVELTRAVASVDVEIQTGASADFTLEKSYIAFAADRGYLSDGIPASMDASQTLEFTPSAAGKVMDKMFIYENDAPVNTARRSTKLILAGRFRGGEITFYPLSLRRQDALTGDYVKGPVQRNMKFFVSISRIHDDGYPSLGAAMEGEDVNVEFVVIGWLSAGETDIIVDGTNWVSIGRKMADVRREIGSTDWIDFSTNVPLGDFSMTLTDGALPDPNVKTTIENDRFGVTLTDEGDGKMRLTFTARQTYGTPLNPSVMTLTAGRIRFDIHIRQIDENPGDWIDGGETEM